MVTRTAFLLLATTTAAAFSSVASAFSVVVSRNLQERTSDPIRYHFLVAGTVGCSEESLITNVDQCEKAALRFGGKLRDGHNPVAGRWDHVPCGCTIQQGSGDIHFDTDFNNCERKGDVNGNDFYPVCSGAPSTKYHALPRGAAGCPDGSGIETEDDCKDAGLLLGGFLRDGKSPVTGSWTYVPCGCSIQTHEGLGDNAIHFDTKLEEDCRQDGGYYPVCKGPPSAKYEFLPLGIPGCPKGTAISTVEECREAGLDVGGTLRDTQNPVTGSWDHVPCGCSVDMVAGDIHFDTESKDCSQNGRYFPVCKIPPPSAPTAYYFEYSLQNMHFEEFDEASADTEKISSLSNGRITNCANGATTDASVEMSLSITNSQSMTVSKSFATSETKSVTAGISVTVEAEAGLIFLKASVAATASFEYSQTWGSERTEEESSTLTTASQITFGLSTTVSVEPQSCVQYMLSSDVSKKPVSVPYTADVHLTVFHKVNETEGKGEQVIDEKVLNSIRALLDGYGAIVDGTLGIITYPVDGVYEGSYATQQQVQTENCVACEPKDGEEPKANGEESKGDEQPKAEGEHPSTIRGSSAEGEGSSTMDFSSSVGWSGATTSLAVMCISAGLLF